MASAGGSASSSSALALPQESRDLPEPRAAALAAMPPTLAAALPLPSMPPPRSRAKRRRDEDCMSVVAASEAPSSVVVADPCPMKRIPPNVLIEEDYVDAVSALIERDFFPDLPQLRVKAELLRAARAGDEAMVRTLSWQLENMARPTPMTTPAGTPCPTPLSSVGGPEAAQERLERGFASAAAASGGDSGGALSSVPPGDDAAAAAAARLSAWERDDDEDDDALSSALGEHESARCARLATTSGKHVVVDLTKVRLDDFQRVFTSEDNASFEKILAEDKKRLREKQWWIEAMEKKHNTTHRAQMKALKDGAGVQPGDMMHAEFKARNALCFFQESLPQLGLEKPKIEVKNTRFTTQQQEELDNMLTASFAARLARVEGERLDNAFQEAAKDGRFDHLSSFISHIKVKETRAIGNQIEVGRGALPFVKTPDFVPGEGFSPMMTYGKVASTPRLIHEDNGPKFSIPETSVREQAADKLQRSAMLKMREQARRTSKEERLRSLGITPTGATPRTATPGSGLRQSPAVSATSKVSPLSPIGQLIHRAQKMAQRGGQLRINSGRSSAAASRAGSVTPGRPAAASASRSARPSSAGPAAKRPRRDDDGLGLPASITDGLLH